MFVGLSNVPRDYAWGSTTAIAELLGSTPSGGPEAELWLGAHPGCPARITDPDIAGETLDTWLAAHPAALGANESLPYLVKVLAAASPLSLQAHPTIAQAEAGFARENAAGIPVDSPDRNYRDRLHKPEIIVALSDEFAALAGFRPLAATRALVAELAAVLGSGAVAAFGERLANGTDEEVLRGAVGWLLSGDAAVAILIADLVAAAAEAPADSPFAREFANVGVLQQHYPGDPGIGVALLLNLVVLHAGQALAVPEAHVHAYLHGLGVEVMAASDNVLRGGLTPKHIDVPELLQVAVFTPLDDAVLQPEHPAPGLTIFRADVDEFVVAEVDLGGSNGRPESADAVVVPFTGPAIALAIDGNLTLTGSAGATTIARGEATFITPDEGEVTVHGAGTAFFTAVP